MSETESGLHRSGEVKAQSFCSRNREDITEKTEQVYRAVSAGLLLRVIIRKRTG